MMNDPVNYVRQGALLASALVLVQHTEFTSSKVKDIRQLYAKVTSTLSIAIVNPITFDVDRWSFTLETNEQMI